MSSFSKYKKKMTSRWQPRQLGQRELSTQSQTEREGGGRDREGEEREKQTDRVVERKGWSSCMWSGLAVLQSAFLPHSPEGCLYTALSSWGLAGCFDWLVTDPHSDPIETDRRQGSVSVCALGRESAWCISGVYSSLCSTASCSWLLLNTGGKVGHLSTSQSLGWLQVSLRGQHRHVHRKLMVVV